MQLICMPIIISDMSMNEVANWNILLPAGMLLPSMGTFGMDSAIPRFIVDKEELEKGTRDIKKRSLLKRLLDIFKMLNK